MANLNGFPVSEDQETTRWRATVSSSIKDLQHSIDRIADDIKCIRDDIKGLRSAISGTERERGLRDRIESLERGYGNLTRIVWVVVTSLISFIIYEVIQKLLRI